MLGLGVRDGLDQGGQLLVERGHVLEHGGVLRVLDEGQELGAERVVDGHAHVVDGGLCGFVEVLVDADRVGQLDGRKRPQVRGEVLVEVGDVACFAGDDLGRRVLAMRKEDREGEQGKRVRHTFRRRSSQRKLRFSSSSCRFRSLMYSQTAITASWRVASRMSMISASSGLSSKRSGSSCRKRLIVMFMFSSPFLLKVNSSKSAIAGRLPAPAGVLSGFFHSTLVSDPWRPGFCLSKSTVRALKKCDNRGRLAGAGAGLGLGLLGVSVSILSPSVSFSPVLRSSSSASSSYSSSRSRPSILTRYDDSRLDEKSNVSTLRLFCQNWSSTVLLTQMRRVLYRYTAGRQSGIGTDHHWDSR